MPCEIIAFYILYFFSAFLMIFGIMNYRCLNDIILIGLSFRQVRKRRKKVSQWCAKFLGAYRLDS